MNGNPISPDVAAEIGRWLGYLGAERRMSGKTVEAYRRDATQFVVFLAEHLGGAPSLKQLAKLTPQDVRAFMAARRVHGIGSRSLMRGLAGARSFARVLERNGTGKVGALAAVRAPKVAKSLPKPLAVTAAKKISDTGIREGEAREPWIIARDAAVLALLYGSGLRISEALSLKRKNVPLPGALDVIIVTGKGNKQRMVPVLPQVLTLIADYDALCPYDTGHDGAMFLGARTAASAPTLPLPSRSRKRANERRPASDLIRDRPPIPSPRRDAMKARTSAGSSLASLASVTRPP
jgi:integrase/recombinase XerC